MTRRFKPSMIHAARADTEQAEMFRERSKPAPAPFERPEPEPAEEVNRQPRAGRPKNIVPPPMTERSRVLGMFDQAMEGTKDPAVKRRLRAAQRQMSTQMKNDVPPGENPAAYGY